MSDNNTEDLRAAGTAVIADVFDRLGMEPPVLDNSLSPVGSAEAFAGPCYTITGEPAVYAGSDRLKLEAIDGIPAGAVAMWAGNGARGVCCFGDLLATAMRSRGCAAAVVDGGVRDVAFLKDCGMPVVARYRTPAQGVGRWRVTAYGVPVQVKGALRATLTVSPSDIVVGDADGVIVVPAQLAPEIGAAVREISQTESEARTEIRAGLPLLAALAKYGHL